MKLLVRAARHTLQGYLLVLRGAGGPSEPRKATGGAALAGGAHCWRSAPERLPAWQILSPLTAASLPLSSLWAASYRPGEGLRRSITEEGAHGELRENNSSSPHIGYSMLIFDVVALGGGKGRIAS